MKILVQCNYDPQNFGGIEMVTRNLIEVLFEKKLEVQVIAGSRESYCEKRNGYSYRGVRILNKFKGAPILLFGNIKFICAGYRSDLIIFQEPYPTLLPAIYILRFLFQKKIIILVHAIPSMPFVIKSLYSKIRGFLLNRVSVVATSPILLDQLGLENNSLSSVIPCCFDEKNCESINIESSLNKINLPQIPERYILYCGRLAEYKGLGVLMQAIIDSPQIQFIIAGEGVMNKYISNKIERYNLKNVIFINKYISDLEKYYLIKNSYSIVLPSINSSEAFAIIQLEAMYFSRPIINTNLKNGVNYVAPHLVSAYSVPVSDSKALTNAIEKVWNDSILAQKLGRAGKSRYHSLFSQFAFKKSWSDYLKFHGF